MVESEIITLIGQVGFPIAISVYLLITRDKVITQNSESIDRLNLTLEKYYFKNHSEIEKNLSS
jgi:hypothetical protein